MTTWLERQRARGPRPFPVAPLARLMGLDPDDTGTLARQLHLHRATVARYRALGLTDTQADEWATRAGLWPGEVWPWWERALRGVALVNAGKETCRLGHPLNRVDSAGRRRCEPCPLAAFKRYRKRKSLATTVIEPGWTQAGRVRAPLMLLDGGMAQMQGSRERLTTLLPPDLSAWIDEQRASTGLSRSAWTCMKLAELRATAPQDEQVAS